MRSASKSCNPGGWRWRLPGRAVGSDLRAVRLPRIGVDTVAAADRATIVGHIAAVPLAPGSLLVRSQLGSSSSLQVGSSGR